MDYGIRPHQVRHEKRCCSGRNRILSSNQLLAGASVAEAGVRVDVCRGESLRSFVGENRGLAWSSKKRSRVLNKLRPRAGVKGQQRLAEGVAGRRWIRPISSRSQTDGAVRSMSSLEVSLAEGIA